MRREHLVAVDVLVAAGGAGGRRTLGNSDRWRFLSPMIAGGGGDGRRRRREKQAAAVLRRKDVAFLLIFRRRHHEHQDHIFICLFSIFLSREMDGGLGAVGVVEGCR